MLKLVFAQTGPSQTHEIGPLPAITIDGETMRAARGGEVLACHQRHEWTVQGRNFFRVDCSCPVKIHFENEKGDSSEVLSTSRPSSGIATATRNTGSGWW